MGEMLLALNKAFLYLNCQPRIFRKVSPSVTECVCTKNYTPVYKHSWMQKHTRVHVKTPRIGLGTATTARESRPPRRAPHPVLHTQGGALSGLFLHTRVQSRPGVWAPPGIPEPREVGGGGSRRSGGGGRRGRGAGAPEPGDPGVGPGRRAGQRSREEGAADRGPRPRPRSRPAGGGGRTRRREAGARSDGRGASAGGGGPGGGWRSLRPEPGNLFPVLRAEAGDAGSGSLRRIRSPGRDAAGPQIPFPLLALGETSGEDAGQVQQGLQGLENWGPPEGDLCTIFIIIITVIFNASSFGWSLGPSDEHRSPKAKAWLKKSPEEPGEGLVKESLCSLPLTINLALLSRLALPAQRLPNLGSQRCLCPGFQNQLCSSSPVSLRESHYLTLHFFCQMG